jgi:hypothetical protein
VTVVRDAPQGETIMRLVFSARGNCCDLAVHPVSRTTARKVRELGSGLYRQKYLNWWRKGNTCAYGMRLEESLQMQVALDGEAVECVEPVLSGNIEEIPLPMYLDSRVSHLCVMGYDNEPCCCSWVWDDVCAYDASGFTLQVQRMDSVLGAPDYCVLDNVLYEGRPADDITWCDTRGFDLITPRVVDLAALRQGASARA